MNQNIYYKKYIKYKQKYFDLKNQIGGHNDARVIYNADNNNIIITKTITCCGNEGHLVDIQSKSKALKHALPAIRPDISTAYNSNPIVSKQWKDARTRLDTELGLVRPNGDDYAFEYYNRIILNIIPIFTVYDNPTLITKMALATSGMTVFFRSGIKHESVLNSFVEYDVENKLYKIFRCLIHLTTVFTFYKDLLHQTGYGDKCYFVSELQYFLKKAWVADGINRYFSMGGNPQVHFWQKNKIESLIAKFWKTLFIDGIQFLDHSPMTLLDFIRYLTDHYHLDERILLPVIEYL